MNSLGRIFRVELFGESHGSALGVVIDGCPAGMALSATDLEPDLARRKAGAVGTTPRRETDEPQIVSGLYQGRTTGAPICILFRNEDTKSSDYESFLRLPRPGHADMTARFKYGGWNDLRGSGHFSGRVTLGLVAAGAIAKRLLGPARFETRILEAGGRSDVEAAVLEALAAGDSVGALVEIRVSGLPAGLGEPFFDPVESLVAHAIFAVPGVRGVEFGDGFRAAAMRGSEHNDPILDTSGRTSKNGAGGVNGGISNGNDLVLRIAVKPTSTIAKAQETVDLETGQAAVLEAAGRHDACIALRSAAALEAACAIALADLALLGRATRPEAPRDEVARGSKPREGRP